MKAKTKLLVAALFAVTGGSALAEEAPQLYGTVIYSDAWQTTADYGVYAFTAQAGTQLTKVHGGQDFAINGAAAYHNGHYLLFRGETQDDAVTAVTMTDYDTDTWTVSATRSLTADCFPADLTTDPTTGLLYGLCASASGQQELAVLSAADGSRTAIGTLAHDMVALAADAYGLLFGIGTNGTLYRISKTDAALVAIGATGVSPQYLQSATFDWHTNRLYWATTTPADVAGIYEVSTTDGRATLLSTFPHNEEVVGLYCLNAATGQPWTGPDVPTAVQQVQLTYAEGQATLTWQAPATGIHGQPIAAEALTYTVVRHPGEAVVAEGLQGTTFTEAFAPESLTALSYTITPYNGTLQGDATRSPSVVAGQTMALPYAPDFANSSDTDLLTTVDGDGDGYTWTFSTAQGHAELEGAPFERTDDYLVLPLMHLDRQYAYRLRFTTCCQWAGNYPYSVAVCTGQGTTKADLGREVFSREYISDNEEQAFDVLLTVPATGDYHVAIKAYGYDIQDISLYDLRMEQGPHIEAPAAVTALTAQPDAEGREAVTLTFTTPVRTVAGRLLTSVSRVAISRDGQPVATLPAQGIGQQLSYTDETAETGRMNRYEVVAVNARGEGQVAETSVWAGFDAPTEPVNIVLAEQEGQAVLTWQAPAVGQHGGVVQAGSLTYAVVGSDGMTRTTTLREPRYEEPIDHSGPQEWLYYGLLAVNGLGYSEFALSNAIIKGTPYELPFYEGFPEGGHSCFWGADDYNQQGWGASWGGYADADADGNGGFFCFGQSGGYPGSGSRLFSGRISLKGAQQPMLTYAYCHRSEEYDDGVLGQPMRVYVVANGTDTTLVSENAAIFFWQIDLQQPFQTVSVPLGQFAEADYIQIVFDVVKAEATYTYLDAVRVYDAAAGDPTAIAAPRPVAGRQPMAVTLSGRPATAGHRGLTLQRQADGTVKKQLR